MITASHFPNLCALVVDDDHLVRTETKDILEEAGLQSLEASNGDEAIALLAQQHAVVALLFTDVQLPGMMTGFAIAHETARRWPHIAIVIASGQRHPGPGDMPEGAIFIPKPFIPTAVHRRLERIFGNKIQPRFSRKAAKYGAIL